MPRIHRHTGTCLLGWWYCHNMFLLLVSFDFYLASAASGFRTAYRRFWWLRACVRVCASARNDLKRWLWHFVDTHRPREEKISVSFHSFVRLIAILLRLFSIPLRHLVPVRIFFPCSLFSDIQILLSKWSEEKSMRAAVPLTLTMSSMYYYYYLSTVASLLFYFNVDKFFSLWDENLISLFRIENDFPPVVYHPFFYLSASACIRFATAVTFLFLLFFFSMCCSCAAARPRS